MSAEETWHACTPHVAFRPLCGAKPRQCNTTSMIERINCAECRLALAEMLNPPAPKEGT